MTVILIDTRHRALVASAPLDRGRVDISYETAAGPYAAIAGSTITFPASVGVDIVNGVPLVPIRVDPTTVDCFARITVTDIARGRSIARVVTIPDVPEIAYGDLQDIDPAEFPTGSYWWALAGGGDFPPEALPGELGFDPTTGNVYQKGAS